MAAQQQNTDQIVRQIIDLLSDGVSELVLLVVVLREQNATMPASLPTYSAKVNDTARKLSAIARRLAANDYKDFPEIAGEINEACDALDQSTKTMDSAVNALSGGGSRQKGWDDLIEACRVMSGKTIRLLQIVYGAPLRRLKINADRLANELNKFPKVPQAKSPQAQQKLLDDLKPITDKALRLEKHLNDRAKVADMPAAKKQLQDAANDTHKAAQDLVDAVNNALKNPDKPVDISGPLDNLRNAADRGRDVAERTAPPAPKGLQSAPMPPPGGKKPQSANQHSGPKSLHDDVEQAKQMAKAFPDLARKEPQNFPEAFDQLKDQVDQVRKKAQPPPDQWQREVEQPLQDILKGARDNNPGAMDKAANDLIRGLDNAPRGPPSARNPPNSPPQAPKGKGPQGGSGGPDSKHGAVDPATRKNIADQLGHIAPEVERAFAKPSDQEKLNKAKLDDNLKNLKANAKNNEPKKAALNTKQAVQAANDLLKNIKDDANNPHLSPEDRKAKQQAAADLERAIPELANTANNALKNFNDPAQVKDLGDKIKKVQRAAERAVPKPPPHGKVGRPEWKKAQDDIAKAVDAVKRGDKPAAKKALDDIKAGPLENIINRPNPYVNRNPAQPHADELDKLFDNFRKAIEKDDPNTAEAQLPQIKAAYKKLAAVPVKAADNLDDAIDDIIRALDNGEAPPFLDLDNAFDRFVNDTEKDPSDDVRRPALKAVGDIKPRLDDFVRKAKEAAKDPSKIAAVKAALPQVKQPIQNFKQAIKPLDGNFDNATGRMQDAVDAAKRYERGPAKQILDDLNKGPFGRNWTPNPNGRGLIDPPPPDGPSDELKKLWDKFRNACNKGDPAEMAKLLPKIEKNWAKLNNQPKESADKVKNAVDDVVDAAKSGNPDIPLDDLRDALNDFENQAQNNPSPQVREAARKAAQDLRPKVNDLIKKAQEAAKNPNDKKKAQDVEAAAAPVKKILDDFKAKNKPLEDAFQKNKDDMKKAIDAVKKNDLPGANRLLDNLDEAPFGRKIDDKDDLPFKPYHAPGEELPKLFDKLNKAADRGDAKAMDRIIPDIEKAHKDMSDRPRDDADDVLKSMDDLIGALGGGGADPPIDDLKDKFNDFVKNSQYDPSPEVREAARIAAKNAKPFLQDAIDKADDAAKNPHDKAKAQAAQAALNQAKKPIEDFKKSLDPLDRDFDKNKNEMKKAADAARRNDKPGAKKALENIANKPFGRTVAPNPSPSVPGDLLLDEPADELLKLWDDFKKDADNGDAKAMDAAIPKMEKALAKAAEKPEKAAEKMKKAIHNAQQAVQKGQNPFPALRALEKAAKDFDKETEDDRSPEVNEAGKEAVNDMDPYIKELIRNAEDAAKNPNDKAKVAAVERAAQQAAKAVDNFKDKLKPLHRAWEKNKPEMKKAVEAVHRGDRPAAKKIIDALDEKPFGRNFKIQKGRGLPPPDPSDGPSDELKNLWNKFKKGVDKGDKGIDSLVPEMNKAYDDYNKAAKADPIAAADKIEKGIDNVLGAVDSGADPSAPLKDLRAAFDDFVNKANDPKLDPATKNAMNKAAENFKPAFVDLANKTKDAASNPNNKEKARALENAVPKAKQPMKNFKAAIAPESPAIVNDKLGGDVKEAVGDLKDAIQNNRQPDVKKALDNVKGKLGKYNDHTHDMAKHIPDDGKARYVDRKAKELDDILDKLKDTDPDRTRGPELEKLVDDIPSIIDDVVSHIGSRPTDDAIEAGAKASNMSAFLSVCSDDDLDLGDLLDTANDLADLMKGMIGETTTVAESYSSGDLTDAARSALELSHLLNDIEGGYGVDSFEDAHAASAKISALRGNDNQSSIPEPPISLADAKTFEDITAAVAYNIRKQCDELHNETTKTAGNVATELANLAAAARSGDRQSMLKSARAAAAHIAALSKELLAIAQKIQPKNAHEQSIQDHLVRCSQGLTNYGTQLKILTSVKAASIEESKDTDESLATISCDLGDLISQALTSMSVTTATILRKQL